MKKTHGTVALYDDVFHACAVRHFQAPADLRQDKLEIRAWFWRTAAGRERWIELQGMVYGTHMHEARVAPGLLAFLDMCREEEVPVSIISHKTELPVIGPRVKLRDAARRWLEEKGFFGQFGLRREDVFFEPEREAKLRRIAEQRCSSFVDDLEEVFREPGFPAGVERLLYCPAARDNPDSEIQVYSSWDSIRNHFLTRLLRPRR